MIDLNSDLGEGFGAWTMGDDAALLDIVTSANIACGFHAGDPSIMRRTCALAVERGVRIGAHISYRDLAGFGRRAMAVSPRELADETLYQIGALDAFARAAGDRVRYVKPHGALYHSASADPAVADAVVSAIAEYGRLSVLGLPGSQLQAAAAAAGIPFHAEGFADRAYTPAATLVPRSEPGSVLDPEAALGQAVSIAVDGSTRSRDGAPVAVPARSLCVHGDSPGAVAMAEAIREALRAKGVELRAFA
ncbi:LamB/YcsF family protein [Nocardia sp. CDC159]|uniref:5-oxoprolinase subunit A n=1 Tax=Nocardia pulmonis TaxID=2951408 RepID=A0A9X2E9U1_9NOCA|nr:MULTISPECIES: 5-oxoprolinase subunit PxpA [Nocardia]MCM6775500.1 LamB/YcsF family protein [Nocardia pulmonis]MCM6787766.1 LamB/YcsF family protein [Nocardia sp. CDC159]